MVEPGAEQRSERRVSRRTFVREGVLGGAALLGLGSRTGGAGAHSHHRHHHRRAPGKGHGGRGAAPPNILTILVDQLRTPVWMPPSAPAALVMPNLAALRARSVSFERHYTAANDCSPSRSVLLTGLYTHQTGVMITGAGWLDPRFPTWGRLLSKMGYETAYYGKWHLNPNNYASLEPYGFSGGTYPSPNGAPGQGTAVDPLIAEQFAQWLEGHSAKTPWATTVSFVNPHDIAWWHRFTERIEAEAYPPARAFALPPNFETPEQLREKSKPLLQCSLQDTAAKSFGAVPFAGPEALSSWTQMMDTYLLLQGYVDVQIGRVMEALASRPEVAANTIVIFTSDHGEYGGSHGLRGKGASAYEEALRVPLEVYDPRGLLGAAPQLPRSQLTSSADVVALMLTIASGSNGWRTEPEYAHLATRLDLAAICANPAAPGREWVLHTTDEDVTEFAKEAHAAEAPRHVVALRSTQGKLALYSNWRPGTMEAEAYGRESEFYDYSGEEGRLEISSQQRSGSALEEQLWQTLEDNAIPDELHAPLPHALHRARREGLSKYLNFEEHEALRVYEAHRPRGFEPPPEAL
ncbi:MAG TPA: sulfatase-like hydrolase/transferase [Solirubrobacteraceae bacterium]|nr:sulfatase-like hydrolase/transferase [Solirubrobacteraceae bacterium]